MTKDNVNDIKKEDLYLTPRQIIFCFMSIFSLALVIRNSDVAIEYMSKGLMLCVRTVIPSLFPFMVISDLLVKSGAVSYLGRILKLPMKILFGVSGEGGCAVLLGTLCGFPLGAKTAVAMYDTEKISLSELERLLTFSNNPSSAFIISAVGISLFGSKDIGVKLYVITLLSAFIVGVAQNIILHLSGKQRANVPCYAPRALKGSAKHKFGIGTFTESITDSAFGIFKICAFVVFFTAFLGTLGSAAESFNIPQELKAFVFGFFELTGGMAQAAEIASEKTGTAVAAFISGWSGVSVHLQIMSICADRGISFKPYFLAKFFQAAICATLILLI